MKGTWKNYFFYCNETVVLAAFASGADYLIHEVMNKPAVDEMVKRRPNAIKLKASILAHHTSAEDAGHIVKEANVKEPGFKSLCAAR